MNGWANASMLEAIDALAKIGRNDLASDLKRITAKIDFEVLEVLRCPGTERLADAIVEADSFSALVDLLGRVGGTLGATHCTVHVVGEFVLFELRDEGADHLSGRMGVALCRSTLLLHRSGGTGVSRL